MEVLYEKSAILLSRVTMGFQRTLLHQVNWGHRLIGILGARGVGKTTLLLQQMAVKALPADQALYINMDELYFTTVSLTETAHSFRKSGGKYIVIDEVHKYEGWARELKNLYDFYRDFFLVFTGSSIVEMLSLEVDLSRRAHVYHLPGFSFREFLAFEYGESYDVISLD